MKNWKKYVITSLVGIISAVVALYGLQVFYDNFRLQSPVIFQAPIIKREVPKKQAKNAPKMPHGAVLAEERPLYTGVEALIAKYFPEDTERAIAIFHAESGLDCKKTSYTRNSDGTWDRGLAMINDIHTPKYQGMDIYNCEDNLKIARRIYDASGWGAWSVYNNGSYKSFL